MYQIDGQQFSDEAGSKRIYDLLSEDQPVFYDFSGGISFIWWKDKAPWFAKAMYLDDDGIYAYGSANKVEDLPPAPQKYKPWFDPCDTVSQSFAEELAAFPGGPKDHVAPIAEFEKVIQDHLRAVDKKVIRKITKQKSHVNVFIGEHQLKAPLQGVMEDMAMRGLVTAPRSFVDLDTSSRLKALNTHADTLISLFYQGIEEDIVKYLTDPDNFLIPGTDE